MGTTREVWEAGSRCFNEHDLEGLKALYAENAEFHMPGGIVVTGPEEIAKSAAAWFQGFPDCRTKTVSTVEQGNAIVEEGIFIGTHTGVFPTPMGDIPPTGKRVEGRYVDIFEVRDGKVVSDRLHFDRMQLMEQLGLVPQPAGAGA